MSTITHANWSAVDTPEFHERFEAALAGCEGLGQRTHELLLAGEAGGARPTVDHVSPADRSRRLGAVVQASPGDVAAAVAAARHAQAEWKRTSIAQRVVVMRRLRELIDRDRFEVMALLSLEIGKNRFEAATEVEEALSLIDAYCDDVVAARGFDVHYPPLGDEENVSVLRPYGVWGILGPFNFPFALSAGPAAAALLMGNVVVVKPPEAAPLACLRLGALAREAGLPAGAFQVLNGGPDVGRALTTDAGVDGVGFTGSFEVGQAIRRALDGKPCIAEMGGKNAAIVLSSADVAVAGPAIARSAFRYSGQKCSATSRVFATPDVIEPLIATVVEEASRFKLGIPWELGTEVGSLICPAARRRYDEAIEAARAAGAKVLVSDPPAELQEGPYAGPAVIVGLPAEHELLRTELFAPIVCVQPVADLDEALRLANDVPFGLTAGLYTTDRDEIDRFLEEIEAGVVYVNRRSGATTGAWVGYQSFGGWKGSGSTGVNAHGPYYVQQFAREQSRTVATR